MNVLYLSDFRGLKSQILVVDHALVAVFFIFNLLPPVQLFFIFVEREWYWVVLIALGNSY